MLHLLHSVPQGNCNWMVKSRNPQKFLSLDDSLYAGLAEQPALSRAVRMVEGTQGGWRHVESHWTVPEILLASRSVSVAQNQVRLLHSFIHLHNMSSILSNWHM